MNVRALYLEPVDGWSFRDGRPFEAGEAFDAATLYPPAPWTTMGCVRTALLRRLCADPESYAGRGQGRACPRCGSGPCAALTTVGAPSSAPPFSLSPPLPARYQGGACSVFFPAPRDLVLLKDERGKTLGTRFLRPMTLPPQVAHSGEFLRPLGVMERGRIAPCEPPWLNTVALETYLEGAAPDLRTNNPPIFHREPRIGVSIDPATRGASDGMLYVREFVRPSEDEGLIVWPSVELDLAGDIGRLGGDGRMVRFHAIDSLALPKPPSLSDPRFRLYCASPSWLRKGHLPGFLDTTTLEGNLDGTTCRLRLVSAALAQTASIGGWDLARQQPRPIRRMIGAGSVYFFEVLSGDAAAAVEQLHGRPFCDDEFMAKTGFGLAFVGRW